MPAAKSANSTSLAILNDFLDQLEAGVVDTSRDYSLTFYVKQIENDMKIIKMSLLPQGSGSAYSSSSSPSSVPLNDSLIRSVLSRLHSLFDSAGLPADEAANAGGQQEQAETIDRDFLFGRGINYSFYERRRSGVPLSVLSYARDQRAAAVSAMMSHTRQANMQQAQLVDTFLRTIGVRFIINIDTPPSSSPFSQFVDPLRFASSNPLKLARTQREHTLLKQLTMVIHNSPHFRPYFNLRDSLSSGVGDTGGDSMFALLAAIKSEHRRSHAQGPPEIFQRCLFFIDAAVASSFVDGQGRIRLAAARPVEEWAALLGQERLVERVEERRAEYERVRMLEEEAERFTGIKEIRASQYLLHHQYSQCEPVAAEARHNALYADFLGRLLQHAHAFAALMGKQTADWRALRVSVVPPDELAGDFAAESADGRLALHNNDGRILVAFNCPPQELLAFLTSHGGRSVSMSALYASHVSNYRSITLDLKRLYRLRSLEHDTASINSLQMLVGCRGLMRHFEVKPVLEGMNVIMSDRYEPVNEDGALTIPWDWHLREVAFN